MKVPIEFQSFIMTPDIFIFTEYQSSLKLQRDLGYLCEKGFSSHGFGWTSTNWYKCSSQKLIHLRMVHMQEIMSNDGRE